ncbi:glycoside hydrolase family 10 protein [Aquabacterium sp. OR-4]|uniref:glycoside hydrolase family 10 protein n=1 Tax=Aquabacterium sp. OR-4 TaxID=2978127 RepID=UPI0028C5E801|nr:family 10 glycosylhydrolase [Aquabacterium sp. OR-4]MDT7838070.1 family 10 glycosylhydrolase [Aquabacterium sp. OR-4]
MAPGQPGPTTAPAPAGPAAPFDALPPLALPEADQPGAAPRELRAAWVASVAHIDWPAQPGLPVAALRASALAQIERAQAIGLNALILQVRPSADALYHSPLEPASEYLSGTQGLLPVDEASGQPFDALAFWVAEAHRRGIELHAWLNPYRARHPSARSAAAGSHVALARPEWVRRHGDLLWLDPGEAGARAHTLAVVADVVRRYDVDAIHLDDYFYPYPVKDASGRDQPFDDQAPWQAYQAGGGRLARDDWRRDNVDQLVRALKPLVQGLKPWVRVGISPFGIGRPALRPAGISGFSQYDQLFADVERWCDEGWMDELAPQLYWPRARTAQAFEPLLDYWLARNSHRHHLWPGLFSSRVADGGADPWPADEVLAQIALQRQRPGARGHIHFSLKALLQDRDSLATRLQREAYAQPALVPATPWLHTGAALPAAPQLRRSPGGTLQLASADGQAPWRWALWRRRAGQWRFDTLPGQQRQLDPQAADTLMLQAIDRLGGEGPRLAYGLDS